ncbi:MAG TPA: OmpH family outer membrane protein [Gemmataceae bacterium]|nr:OmpH family outer membrane protein [Gemmataceae bacterium]
MKRTLAIVIGLMSVGAAVYVGSRLWAQQGTPGAAPVPAPVRTPVRVINMSKVVKKYNRWINFQNEYRELYKREYEQKIEKLKGELQVHTAKLQDSKTPEAERTTAEKEVRRIQRQMQEISDDAKQTLGKKEADMIVIIYKEIEEAVQQFARASAVELVMHYNDATEEPDLHSTANIHRKLSYGGCVPLYIAPGMDISDHIIQFLNSRHPLAAPPATGASNAPRSGTPQPGTTVPPNGSQPGTGVTPAQYNPQRPRP